MNADAKLFKLKLNPSGIQSCHHF